MSRFLHRSKVSKQQVRRKKASRTEEYTKMMRSLSNSTSATMRNSPINRTCCRIKWGRSSTEMPSCRIPRTSEGRWSWMWAAGVEYYLSLLRKQERKESTQLKPVRWQRTLESSLKLMASMRSSPSLRARSKTSLQRRYPWKLLMW